MKKQERKHARKIPFEDRVLHGIDICLDFLGGLVAVMVIYQMLKDWLPNLGPIPLFIITVLCALLFNLRYQNE